MKIAVIGGGITGLTSAYFLGKAGYEVELFEAKETLGGLADSYKERKWDWQLEKYFHHYFTSDKYVKNLAEELGIEKKLFFKKVQTSVYSGGNIYPFDEPLDIMKYPDLNNFSKLRMGGIIFFLRLLPYLPFYDRFTAEGLFSSLIGNTALQKVWQPLMENKFHQYTDKVTFSWLWARLKKRSQKLGYFEGGTAVLISKLQEEIEKKSKIRFKTRITSIKKSENKWILAAEKREFTADKVIIAVPLSQALKLIQTWKELRDKKVSTWRGLKANSAMTLVMRLEKKFLPGNSYWLNVLEKDYPFLVIVEQTNFIDANKYGGENVVYVGGYYPQEDSRLRKSKEEILGEFSPYLRRLNPSFENYLIDYQLFKYPDAQPIIPTNYSKIKPKTSLISDQLFWATANHIFPWDRGVNYSIKIGKEIAAKI